MIYFFQTNETLSGNDRNMVNIEVNSQEASTQNMQDGSAESTCHIDVSTPNLSDVSTPNASKRRKTEKTDPRVQAAFEVMSSLAKRNVRDASDVFGEHVAAKHRKYDDHVKSIVEHEISKILFEADMGKYDLNIQRSTVYQPSTCSPITVFQQQEQPVIIHVPEASPSNYSPTDSECNSRPNSTLPLTDNPTSLFTIS